MNTTGIQEPSDMERLVTRWRNNPWDLRTAVMSALQVSADLTSVLPSRGTTRLLPAIGQKVVYSAGPADTLLVTLVLADEPSYSGVIEVVAKHLREHSAGLLRVFNKARPKASVGRLTTCTLQVVLPPDEYMDTPAEIDGVPVTWFRWVPDDEHMLHVEKIQASDSDHFQAFLCAGILDLCRLVKLPDLKEFCPGARSSPCPAHSAGTPRVVAVAQLSLYLLLLARGLAPKHTVIYPHRDRLRDLLKRVHAKAIKTWDRGELKDVEDLHTSVRTLAKFARRNIEPFEFTRDGLDAFGVKSAQRSLQLLTEKMAAYFAREIAKKLAKDPDSVPPELLGASLVASATAPGVVERIGGGSSVKAVMKLGVRAGLAGAASRKPGAKTPAPLDDLRKFLKRAGQFLDG